MSSLLSRLFGGSKKTSKSVVADTDSQETVPASKPAAKGKRSKVAIRIPVTIKPEDVRAAFNAKLFAVEDGGQPATQLQKVAANNVLSDMQDTNKRQKAVPHLPTIIPRLIRSLRDPAASAVQFADIINKDPVMSAAVLKLSNSVYFNPSSSRIDNIERAVVKLGIDGLRSVLSAAVMQPIIQRKAPYFPDLAQKLWAHSLCCAVACEEIAKRRGLEPYKAYIMGLCHDIGKITLFSELARQFQKTASQEPGPNAFIPLLNQQSVSLGHMVGRDWELPDEVCSGLAEQIGIKDGSRVRAYGEVLFQANLVCEVYAAYSRGEREKLFPQYAEAFNLPYNLYSSLHNLSVEVGG